MCIRRQIAVVFLVTQFVRIGARQTWFTHIAHELGHEETNRNLPANAHLAYDGLSVPVTL